MPVRPPRPVRAVLSTATAAVLVAGLAGCSLLGGDGAGAVPATSTPAAAPSVDESAAAIALRPDGSATDNLPLFTAVVGEVWASADAGRGMAYIDALTAAGFDRAQMQVTADRSTVGNAAESIQFSVRWGEDCLIGQVGPATGDPVATVVPGLAEGGCLIGDTAPIDG